MATDTIHRHLLVLLLASLCTAGCQRTDTERTLKVWRPSISESDEAATALPTTRPGASGVATMPSPHGAATMPTTRPALDAHAFPLKQTGLNSFEELRAGMARLSTPEARANLERGFRACFTVDKLKRDFGRARQAFNAVLAAEPTSAVAHRGLGAVAIHMDFNTAAAIEHYRKAIALDPEYGAAHYALGLVLMMTDKQAAATHLTRARELGVETDAMLNRMLQQQ